MEKDLTESKNELDILAKKELILFQSFLYNLKPENIKLYILYGMVLEENEKHLTKLEDYVYKKYPYSESILIAGKGFSSQDSQIQILLLNYVYQIHKEFNILERKYLKSVFSNETLL